MIRTQSITALERAKYDQVWRETPDYRTHSPGEALVGPFLAISGAQPGQRVVDVGCGTGRAALTLHALRLEIVLVDGSAAALDADVRAALGDGFLEACLWSDWPARIGPQDVVFCTDVLEHLPTEFTMLVVARCLEAAPRCFFHIHFDLDYFGPRTIGEPLHLTAQPFVWWRDRLGELGNLREARDLMGHGLFLLERRS